LPLDNRPFWTKTITTFWFKGPGKKKAGQKKAGQKKAGQKKGRLKHQAG
jgi:hypothetical protein